MRMPIIAILICSVMLAGQGWAQMASLSNKEKLAVKLVTTSDADNQDVWQAFEVMNAQAKAQLQQLAVLQGAGAASISDTPVFTKKDIEFLQAILYKGYLDNFSEKEMELLYNYTRTPEGRNIASKNAGLMQRFFVEANRIQQTNMKKILDKLNTSSTLPGSKKADNLKLPPMPQLQEEERSH